MINCADNSGAKNLSAGGAAVECSDLSHGDSMTRWPVVAGQLIKGRVEKWLKVSQMPTHRPACVIVGLPRVQRALSSIL